MKLHFKSVSLSISVLYPRRQIEGACKHNPTSSVLIPTSPETLKSKLRITQFTPSVQSAMLEKKKNGVCGHLLFLILFATRRGTPKICPGKENGAQPVLA